MRALRLAAVAVVLALGAAGCTDKVTLGSTDEGDGAAGGAFELQPERGEKDTVFRVDAGRVPRDTNVTWDWGDGTFSYGAKAEHKYGFTNGVMTVTLLLATPAGETSVATRALTLGNGINKPPTANIRAGKTWVEVGAPVNLTASGSDPDRDPLQYFWTATRQADAQAGTAARDHALRTDGARATAIFDEPGAYLVRLVAKDPKGGAATAERQFNVSREIPSALFEAAFSGNLTVGTAGASLSEKAWLADQDTNVDTARHFYTLQYPASTIVFLTWNDTSGQGAFDLDLELRDVANGSTVFKSETRAPAVPMEFNVTAQPPGEYVLIVRAIAGATVRYDLLVYAAYQITPETVAAAERRG